MATVRSFGLDERLYGSALGRHRLEAGRRLLARERSDACDDLAILVLGAPICGCVLAAPPRPRRLPDGEAGQAVLRGAGQSGRHYSAGGRTRTRLRPGRDGNRVAGVAIAATETSAPVARPRVRRVSAEPPRGGSCERALRC